MKGVSGAKIKEGGMIEVDNQILLKLYSLYQKELYYIVFTLWDRHLAEDLLHETFLKALLPCRMDMAICGHGSIW
mgnify:CR=1 FL=1